jgi:hypothetical protein
VSGQSRETLSDVVGGGFFSPFEPPSSHDLKPEDQQDDRSSRVPSDSEDATDDDCGSVNPELNVQASETLAEEVFHPTPQPCNTGVSIRHQGLESGGLDTLEVSLYGGWNIPRFDELKQQLDQAKKHAESGLDESAYVISPEGDQVKVQPFGTNKGVGCRWVLKWNGCQIAIVNNCMYSENRLSIHVTIGSLRLMQVGHQEAWESVMALLVSFGYQHVLDVVGRADICTDHANRTMAEVEAALNQRRLICRARKSKRYENADKLETYVRGSGPMLVRIYDKGIECRNDSVKREVMIARRWGKRCEHAVRVEFQLRNKALRRHFQIRTVDELFQRLGTVATWCSSEWFRIVNKFDRKNRNHARATVSEFWEEVQEQFQSWTGTALPRTPRELKLKPSFKQLKQQAVGCVSSIAAHFPDREFMESWVKIGRDFMSKAEAVVEEKRMKLAAAARIVIVPESEIPF